MPPGDTAFVGTAGAREKFYVRVQDEQSIPVTQSVPKTFLDVKVNPNEVPHYDHDKTKLSLESRSIEIDRHPHFERDGDRVVQLYFW